MCSVLKLELKKAFKNKFFLDICCFRVSYYLVEF